MQQQRMMGLLLFLCFLSCGALALVIGPIEHHWKPQLPEGVTVIKSTDAYYPDSTDLLPFYPLARRAEIFAIGEDAHGVAGYQDFQFRLSKFLITHLGYRRILSEILSLQGPLNTYLTTGVGNLTEILYINPWHGSDINMFNFFSWVRQFNAKNPRDMVTAYTVDPQNPWEDAPVIKAFLAQYDAKYNQSFSTRLFPAIYKNCFGASSTDQIDWAYSAETTAYYSCGCLPYNKTATCVSSITYVEDMIRSEMPALTKWLGETPIGDVLYALRSLRAWQTKSASMGTDLEQAMRYREAAFGLNVMWKASRYNHKRSGSILLTHNLHASKAVLLPNFIQADYFSNLHSVGYILHKNLGDKYVAVAQSGFNVTAMFQRYTFPLPTSNLSIDVKLKALNQNYLLLDTSARWVTKQGTWLVHEEAVPNGRYYNLHESFDRLVFHAVAPAGVFVQYTPASAESAPGLQDVLRR